MGLMHDVRGCDDSATGTTCAGTEVQVQPTLELIGSLVPVRGYTVEAAREMQIVEETARDIAELIEQELD